MHVYPSSWQLVQLFFRIWPSHLTFLALHTLQARAARLRRPITGTGSRGADAFAGGECMVSIMIAGTT